MPVVGLGADLVDDVHDIEDGEAVGEGGALGEIGSCNVKDWV